MTIDSHTPHLDAAVRGTAQPDRTTRPRSSLAGPTAKLLPLPQLDGGLPATPRELDMHLGRIEAARRSQLDALPAADPSPVAVAHRRVVQRILDEVRLARRRLQHGQYGRCAGCSSLIAPDLLERRPWSSTCAGCDSSDT
ncbi:MAG TPA: hypothetical protein VGD39_06270 [Nocardioides sp.]